MKSKTKARDGGYIVVCYDGFNKEYQAFDPKIGAWEFGKSEIEAQCRKEIAKGAVKVECWRINTTPPEMVLAFKRSEGGGCVQTFPDVYKQTYRNPFSKNVDNPEK